MKLKDILGNRERGISFEFFPPTSAGHKDGFMRLVKELRRFDPLYVSVAYGAGGITRDRTRTALLWIKDETDLTVMSHLTCIGATEGAMEILLNNYIANGIDTILVLRGDPPRRAGDSDPAEGDFQYAIDLVEFAKRFNSFSIGVAVYPEGHPESPSIAKDMEFTRMKIDSGADFGITQMFFDNRYYYDFMDRAAGMRINIPILPGIMPIMDMEKIKRFSSVCKATIPEKVEKKMMQLAGSRDDMMKAGIEFTVRQCEDLIANGVSRLHFYTLNRVEAVSEIMEALKGTF